MNSLQKDLAEIAEKQREDTAAAINEIRERESITLSDVKSLSRAKILEIIYAGLTEIAFDYVNGDKEERQIIIEELNKVIAGMRSEIARLALTKFRDGLLDYSGRREVENA